MPTKMTIRAHEPATLLDRGSDGITTLPLNCFDTLLWRNTPAPQDVFCGIPLAGGAIRLADVYRRMMITAAEEDIAAAVEHELTLEPAEYAAAVCGAEKVDPRVAVATSAMPAT
ncbi:hypothetical protein [uncultured Sphingomonas sp.]|uniref:hypothetical protein n=1 Tax=uncultured Sphingomonas sp. TaxID=158754 RepID=UPI0025F17257|nr:hypothetical protein [uncultured Sphingomonas sp.]